MNPIDNILRQQKVLVVDGASGSELERKGLDAYGNMAKHWFQTGATVIGGCCRTAPQDIAQIAKWARGI